jgi:translation initiation factor 2B subunit (eIF-2B alpha/beta/delta family)
MREHRSNLPDRVRQALDEIASDNRSGAAEILCRAAALYSQLDSASEQETIDSLSIELALAQPRMSPLIRLANEVMKSSTDAAARFVENAARAASAAATHAASLIHEGARVLTHSRSSTVLEAFAQARRAGKSFSIVATESRPLFEGRTLAEALVKQHVPVTVIIDAAAALAIEEVDLVLVGADAITPISVINKVGTRMIALAAREKGIRVFSVCDTSKFICEDCLALEREQPTAESWFDAPAEVGITNKYFESTPLAWFTGIVTEHGILSSNEAAQRADEVSIDGRLVEASRGECEIK